MPSLWCDYQYDSCTDTTNVSLVPTSPYRKGCGHETKPMYITVYFLKWWNKTKVVANLIVCGKCIIVVGEVKLGDHESAWVGPTHHILSKADKIHSLRDLWNPLQKVCLQLHCAAINEFGLEQPNQEWYRRKLYSVQENYQALTEFKLSPIWHKYCYELWKWFIGTYVH